MKVHYILVAKYFFCRKSSFIERSVYILSDSINIGLNILKDSYDCDVWILKFILLVLPIGIRVKSFHIDNSLCFHNVKLILALDRY